MQSRARDSVRKADISQLETAMGMYYMDNGSYIQVPIGLYTS